MTIVKAKIKLVADLTDYRTKLCAREYWDKMATPSMQKKILDKNKHSYKWVGVKFKDLTGEIQSFIFTDSKYVNIDFKIKGQ
jgi:hypothetical protein